MIECSPSPPPEFVKSYGNAANLRRAFFLNAVILSTAQPRFKFECDELKASSGALVVWVKPDKTVDVVPMKQG
jgi:hypothetical protein